MCFTFLKTSHVTEKPWKILHLFSVLRGKNCQSKQLPSYIYFLFPQANVSWMMLKTCNEKLFAPTPSLFSSQRESPSHNLTLCKKKETKSSVTRSENKHQAEEMQERKRDLLSKARLREGLLTAAQVTAPTSLCSSLHCCFKTPFRK